MRWAGHELASLVCISQLNILLLFLSLAILAERVLVRMGNKCNSRFAFVTVYLDKQTILFSDR